MKRTIVAAALVILVSLTVVAASRHKATDTNFDFVAPAISDRPSVWLDYYNPASVSLYYWTGDFYMTNIFKPEFPSWYPFTVTRLEIWPHRLEGQTATGAVGVINRARVFQPGTNAGIVNMVAEEVNIPANVQAWNLVTFATPPTIASGNFLAGLWNYGASAAQGDGGWQGTMTNWTPPPAEPFVLVQMATSALPSGTASTAGYPTMSSVSVRAECTGPTVPVELMRFTID